MFLILGAICLVIASVADAIRDALDHRFEESKFGHLNPNFWNRIRSGENKWKGGKKENGEKFFLSSTLLAFTTEAWHLFKMIFMVTFSLGFMFIALGSNDNLLLLAIYWIVARFIVFGLPFTFLYKHLKNEKLRQSKP